MNKTALPLQGIKVLDLSRHLPAPLAGLFLADMGAEVIKIEDIHSPDPIRLYPPFIGNESVYFLALNRNKSCLSFDFRSKQGKADFLELLATADIVIESFRAGVLQQIGIDYATARTINRRIIYVSVTGYGQNGNLAGHDLNFLAKSGVLSLNIDAENRPIIPIFQLGDVAGGTYPALNACLLALYRREKTGEGCHVDVAITDNLLPLLALPLAVAQVNGEQETLQQNRLLSGSLPNYNVYRCADNRYVALGALEPKFWRNFCRAAQHEEWENELMSGDMHDTLTHFFAQYESHYWQTIFEPVDCCFSLVKNLSDILQAPCVEQHQLLVHQHIADKDFKSLRYPIRFVEE